MRFMPQAKVWGQVADIARGEVECLIYHTRPL